MVLRKSIVRVLIIFCFSLTLNNAYTQEQYLEVTNLKTNKVKKIKEKKRITVFTKDSKIRGPLKILDNETLLIKDTEVKIRDIIMIKKKSIAGKILAYFLLPSFTLSAMGILAITGASSAVISTVGVTGISLTIFSILSRKKFKNETYKFNVVYE